MLHEQIEKLTKDYEKLKGIVEALGLLPGLRLDIQKICSHLDALIKGGDLSTIDANLKAALESVYNILKATEKGLGEEPLAQLFENPGKH